ncbi:MAG: hypothetical protein QNL88_00795 [Acidobacteriota bacterium]|nr:hypothetical protein [Acidobacteriota bacterium]
MKTEFERLLKTEYDRAFAINGAATAPEVYFLSQVVFPSFWSNIRPLM